MIRAEGDWKADRLEKELKMTNEEIGKIRRENKKLRELLLLSIRDNHKLLPRESPEDRLEYLLSIVIAP